MDYSLLMTYYNRLACSLYAMLDEGHYLDFKNLLATDCAVTIGPKAVLAYFIIAQRLYVCFLISLT